ncbi:MAG: shikimate dehydrogenase [Zetaproteobacteria bacterium CG12_big_fil_rev_8_21_14_0_65_54_13]|nr:MAG: shikimate dehydrogenase [Zetaproteobacteria bacterium CG12_big_fil_rev_8_21_14_0_65_54_13]PIX53508.1 MAG: shikimate dehydrogenase [Zetaproteobacteria bacterium CG_4_10_14_3_um_filter_54_28]PJA28318.1 MAG: shikimate dehydrogenase [Zetaproteobacteria bacterium CG_4_9_14_3_um_filter_54_145]
MEINGMTKLYGIVGWPVSHSLSPLFQSCFIEDTGINAAYLPFAVEPEQLGVALDGLLALGVEGFNVTVPHKEQVLQMVDADADARKIGAVNSVRRCASGWQATNTDWRGFKAVVEGLELDLTGQNVLLFGAGGTSRAVLHALAALGVGRVFICNRNPQRLAVLIEHATATYPHMSCLPLAWAADAVDAACRSSLLLINTTTIGLQDGQPFPFVPAGVGAAIDAVYRPDGMTAFCLAAAKAGRAAVDGLPMLIAQGAASFAWWHDCPSPDCSATLRRIESRLGRPALGLPGWSGL